MDETRAAYGTTNEVSITLSDNEGNTKTFKLPNAKDTDTIGTYATAFASLATDSSTAVIGVDGVVPTKIIIDVIETTRTNVYRNE